MAKQNWKSKITGFRYSRPAAGLLLIVLLSCIPLLVRSPYYMHLVIITGMNAVLAMTFILMLRSGLINLAIAAFWGIGAYASSILVMKAGLSFWLALPAATLITGFIAWCMGFLMVRNAGFGFLILTAVVGMIMVLVFGSIPYLGGFTGIEYIPRPGSIHFPLLEPVTFTSKEPYFFLMLFLFLLVCFSFRALYASSIGRAWMAIGLNPNLAASIGVDVLRYRLLAFVIASIVAGLEGGFYAHYIGAINPHAFNIFKTINVHIYSILGGMNYAFLGPVVGTFIMTFVPESLRIAKEVEPIITGVLLILLIIFLPGGILSLLNVRHRPCQSLKNILGIEKTEGKSEGSHAGSQESK